MSGCWLLGGWLLEWVTVKGCPAVPGCYATPLFPAILPELEEAGGLSFINEVHKNAFNWCEKRAAPPDNFFKGFLSSL